MFSKTDCMSATAMPIVVSSTGESRRMPVTGFGPDRQGSRFECGMDGLASNSARDCSDWLVQERRSRWINEQDDTPAFFLRGQAAGTWEWQRHVRKVADIMT